MPQYSLKVTKNTILKSEPIQSYRISDTNLKDEIAKDIELLVHSYK
jgi:hypothetical protein